MFFRASLHYIYLFYDITCWINIYLFYDVKTSWVVMITYSLPVTAGVRQCVNSVKETHGTRCMSTKRRPQHGSFIKRLIASCALHWRSNLKSKRSRSNILFLLITYPFHRLVFHRRVKNRSKRSSAITATGLRGRWQHLITWNV